MAFKYKGSVTPTAGQVLKEIVIANSKTITVGDVVQIASDFADLAGAGTVVYGVVVGITKENGEVPADNGAGGAFSDTYTTAADNQTVAKIKAKVDVSKNSLWSAPADANLGTTTGSDYVHGGVYFDVVAASDTLDESTAGATVRQFYSHGVDPQDSTRVIVSIAESIVQPV